MTAVINWFQEVVRSVPLPVLEVWGRCSYLIGLVLAVCAFGGFTFRLGDRWGFGRERQAWDEKAFVSIPLTFVLTVVSGYVGSFVVLVPGAQTFESLKDLVVLLCVVLFGYPALLIVPFAYGLSDLIEGVPPDFILDWLPGYFINPACFWLAYQLFSKDPDFRRGRTWRSYLTFVLLFTALEPVLWGFVCSGKFTPEISYRAITPALLFTTTITWIIAPFAMLGALPLARRFGLFWAEISGHVTEQRLGGGREIWESGRGEAEAAPGTGEQRLPIRMFILAPFIALLLIMVGATAFVALWSAQGDANRLAGRLHREISDNLKLRLDDYLASVQGSDAGVQTAGIGDLLRSLPIAADGRAFIVERSGVTKASSVAGDDAVANDAIEGLRRVVGELRMLDSARQFRFDHITPSPSRETWLVQATPYPDGFGDWIVITAMPEAFYQAGVREGNSRSAMVFTLALLLCLAVAAMLASTVTAPLRRLSTASRALARGDLTQRVPGSRLEEVDVLAESFNHMAQQLKGTFDRVLSEVEVRKRRESDLEASEARARTSEERLQMAIRAAGLGIWDWDIEKDELIWDDSMYRLYGVSRDEFGGAFAAWSRCLVEEDLPRATADVQAALRGDRAFASEFSVRRDDGAIRVIRGLAETIRSGDGRPLRMVGINWDVTERLEKEHERERLVHDLGERVKELRLLHAAARLLQRDRAFDRTLLEELVVLMPQAWQFPECCVARVTYGDIQATTLGWRDSPWRQSAPFVTGGGSGLIEVVYLDERPSAAEGPFLAEERALIDSLAEMLVAYVELRQYQEGLEALVESRTAELQSKNVELEHESRQHLRLAELLRGKNEELKAFSYTVSHDLKAPLRGIAGYAQELDRRHRDGLSERAMKCVDHILTATHNLDRLIDDLLHYASLDAQVPTGIEVDLAQMIDGILRDRKPVILAQGVEVTVHLSSTAVRAWERGLLQLTANLIDNALKYSRDATPPRVDITSEELPAAYRITITDNGIGFDMKYHDRIFGLFNRLVRQEEFEGTGAGLAIVKKVVEKIDGRIWADSTPGLGATFFVEWPKIRADIKR